MGIVATVSGAWNAFATNVGAFLPHLFAALIIVILGWIGCNVAKRISIRLLKICRFDSLADRSGINGVLARGGIQQSATEILSLLIFWFLFLIVIVATLGSYGLMKFAIRPFTSLGTVMNS